MHGLAPIIQDLMVILVTASITTLIFHYIRQPVVLGYLIAGMIVGPYPPFKSLVSDIPNIKVIAELGVIFLMFSLGLEFSFHKLARVGFSAGITGLIEVSLISGLGFVTARLLGWPIDDSLFLGAAISISSTTIIIKSLDELRLKSKRFAELIFGLLVVEDLLAILLLVILTTVVTTHNIFSPEIFWAMGKLFVVVGSWFLIGYFIVPYFFRNVIQYASQETLTIVSIAFCLSLVSIAAYFNYSSALGAFIMGSILAETPQVHRIEELIRPIRDIFAAVFFVSVGMLINPQVIMGNFPTILLITVVMILGKMLAPSVGFLLTGQSLNTSLRASFSMAQIGEFSFIIAGLGITLGVTSEKLYPTIVAVSVISTFTGPYLIRFSGQLVSQVERRLSTQTKSFLQNYSAWVYQSLADRKDRSSYRKATTRFVINSIMLALVFTLTDTLVSPYLDRVISSSWLDETISWLIALMLSSPFLWAMLFAFKLETNQTNKSALTLQIILIWIMTFAEVIFFSFAYFHTWIIALVLLTTAVIFFGLLYTYLGNFYQWIEKHLLANINQSKEAQDQFKQLAPWESHLVYLTVSRGSSCVGKTLEENKVREEYGVNIVAIQREDNLVLAPRGNRQLMANDRLIVLGSDEQIDHFRKMVEVSIQPENNFLLERFILKAILLDQESRFIGLSIRDSQIREQAHGLVVGLERHGHQKLNPDPATILKAGDILLMVGETQKLEALA